MANCGAKPADLCIFGCLVWQQVSVFRTVASVLMVAEKI